MSEASDDSVWPADDVAADVVVTPAGTDALKAIEKHLPALL